MRLNLYHGGNRKNLPWEPMLLSGNTYKDVRYAAHLPTKHRVLPFFFSQSEMAVRDFLEEFIPGGLVQGTELGLHLLAEGTLVKNIVFEVKTPIPGAVVRIALKGVAGDTPAAATPADPAQTIDDTTDASATDASDVANAPSGTAGSETGELAGFNIDMSQAGKYRLPVSPDTDGLFLQDEGVVTLTVTTAPAVPGALPNTPNQLYGACFTLYTELVHFADQNQCPCVALPCGAEFPEPAC